MQKLSRFSGLLLFAVFSLTACQQELKSERIVQDVLAQSYVKNCARAGLKPEVEVLEQNREKEEVHVKVVLHFDGEHDAASGALLCDKNMGATLIYATENGQATVQRLQLQPTRRQLNVLRGG